jgi:hypothetical protein
MGASVTTGLANLADLTKVAEEPQEFAVRRLLLPRKDDEATGARRRIVVVQHVAAEFE